MKLDRIDLNLFVVFDTIYAEGNLTRASEILHVTQPAVSNALARLRQTFDDPLFVRAGRRMAPTPVAQNLIGPVRQALRQLQASVDTRAEFRPGDAQRRFHLSISDIAASLLLPGLLAALQREAPRVALNCHQLDRREIAGELAAGTLDLAIDIPQLARASLHHARLQRDRFVCVLRHGHALARRSLTLERYLALDHVTVSSRRAGRSYVDLALGRLGRQVESTLRVQHYQPAFHVVQNSDMALAAPLSLARRYRVLVRDLPFDVPVLDSHLYWHRSAENDPGNRWLRGLIADLWSRREAEDAEAGAGATSPAAR